MDCKDWPLKKEEFDGRGLVDKVFSWSITDVLNQNLYQNQVKKIPETFSSTSIYMDSFILPLLEETHADLLSSMNTLSQAPTCEITHVTKTKTFQLHTNLSYDLFVLEEQKKRSPYMPAVGDLVALTNVRPKCIDDLNRPYVIAYVHKMKKSAITPYVTVLSSKLIMADAGMGHKKNEPVFAVYLTNLTTNIRIWRSLKGELGGMNMKIIDRVLQGHSSGNSYTCTECHGKELTSENDATSCYFDLNVSQRDAVLSCISLVKCHHENTIKLIWGPPGTGKTTTVSVMLSSLLTLKCRTLTCAPTNVAVLEIAKRVLKQVKKEKSPRFGGCYGLGDIVLFGNEKRMDMYSHKDLNDVFLDYRVLALRKCLRGWKYNLASMISLLEDPKQLYKERYKVKGVVEARMERTRPQKKKNEHEMTVRSFQPLTLEEFVSKRFNSLNAELNFCIVNLYKHLPTSSILQEDMMNMFRAHDLLHSLTTLFCNENEFIDQVFYDQKDDESDGGVGSFSKWRLEIKQCLHVLKLLPMKFSLVQGKLRDFCLSKACLIFCTVSSSAKLHAREISPIETLVIDEAAMLKECESTIPLQLPGIRHTTLIGDDRQLPAMVQSKICEKADFGRSLFERLVQLGHKKHLLNVQHRMHPTISLFPNIEFYESEIVNAQSVKEVGYNRSFLPGKMFGSYSFIDVPMGKEEFDDNHSRRNMVEASIVYELIKKLHEECVRRKTKVRVGVISPYKAQVYAIENKMKMVSFRGGFEVNVRSVDGFQGGEEDVIIISTVRCNEKGSIGFLSDRRRVNVALTRARHCLWILGNGTTLLNSESVWKTLVIDAKNRGTFYNAQEDKSLSTALLYSLVQLKEMDNLGNVASCFFSNAIWKLCFSEEFWYSLERVGNMETFKQVLCILEKLSNGWHDINKRKKMFVHDGISSQLLEQNNVNRRLCLIWTVDILEKNFQCTQVIMVWGVLPRGNPISKIAKCVDLVYNSYTAVEIDRCKYKCLHGNLVYPMRWPMDSNKSSEVQALELSKSFASLRIYDVFLKIEKKFCLSLKKLCGYNN